MSDYIKREDAIRTMTGGPIIVDKGNVEAVTRIYEEFVKRIDAIPSADVRENAHGFWLNEEQKDGYIAKRCSNCFEVSGLCLSDKWFDFCPHCGADMRGNE